MPPLMSGVGCILRERDQRIYDAVVLIALLACLS